MHSVRVSRGATVVAVVVWQFTALVLLPAALCRHAAVAHDAEDVPACCKGAHHGAACPMSRGSAAGHGAEMDHGPARRDSVGMNAGHPRLHTCHVLDDTLIGLLGLTAFTPDTFRVACDPAAAGRVTDAGESAVSLHTPPATPPPRV